MVENVEKGGTSWLEFSIARAKFDLGSQVGLQVTVKAHPKLEGFMKSLGNGKTEPVRIYGTDWRPVLDAPELMVYNLEHAPVLAKAQLDYAGAQLRVPVMAPDGSRTMGINLSFLRLIGISEPNGVTFNITGAYSKNYVNEVTSEIVAATKQLIQEYIGPVTLNAKIMS